MDKDCFIEIKDGSIQSIQVPYDKISDWLKKGLDFLDKYSEALIKEGGELSDLYNKLGKDLFELSDLSKQTSDLPSKEELAKIIQKTSQEIQETLDKLGDHAHKMKAIPMDKWKVADWGMVGRHLGPIGKGLDVAKVGSKVVSGDSREAVVETGKILTGAAVAGIAVAALSFTPAGAVVIGAAFVLGNTIGEEGFDWFANETETGKKMVDEAASWLDEIVDTVKKTYKDVTGDVDDPSTNPDKKPTGEGSQDNPSQPSDNPNPSNPTNKESQHNCPWNDLDPHRQPTAQVHDPLILDLDGDGIETIAMNGLSGSLFDHNNNGLRIATGWAGKDDGMLVRDLNGNGTIDNALELMSDKTRLANGETAAHGYEALADLDSNQDGKVDSADEAFGSLKVWQDKNQDGISQADELHTLESLGIQSLNTAYEDVNQDLENGNILGQSGTYTKTDGSTAQMGDVWFTADEKKFEFANKVELTEEQSKVVNLAATGRVRELREAAALSADLNAVIEQYTKAETRTEQRALLSKLAVEWAKTDPEFADASKYQLAVAQLPPMTAGTSGSSGGRGVSTNGILVTPTQAAVLANLTLDEETQRAFDEAKFKIAVLDAVKGTRSRTFYYGTIEQAKHIIEVTNAAFGRLTERMYKGLLFQTRLKPYVNEVALKLENNQFTLDFSALQAAFEQVHTSNPQKALVDLGEFLAYGNVPTWYAGRTLMKRYVDEARSAGTLDTMLAELGKDTVALLSKTHGDKENNVLQNVGLQNSSYTYLSGNDGDDVLIASAGENSHLSGGYGSDVYVLGRDFKSVSISNGSRNQDDVDTIYFTDGIKQADLTFTRNSDNLLIQTKEGDNQVTVSNFFYADEYQINRIIFEDGTTLTVDNIKEMVQQSTDGRDNLYAYDSGSLISAGTGNDYLYGAKGNDTLNGDDGNDQIYGRAGDDVLNGGAGNDGLSGEDGNDTLNGGTGDDYLNGGAGNDTLNGGEGNDSLNAGDGSDVYVFAKNFGQDTIYNNDTSANRVDTIQFTDGITQADLTFTRSSDNLLIKTKEGENQVTVSNFFYADEYQIDHITFEDGTVLDVAAIKEIVQQGTDSRDNLYAYDSGSLISAGAGHDYLYGAKGNDTLNGDDGNDQIYGRAGDDVLNGGAGNDNLQGDAGNDTLNGGEGNDSLNAGDGSDVYVFAKNFGQDTIYNYDKSANRVDTIQFTDGIKQADLTFTRSSDNLLIKTKEGENQVTVSNFFYADEYQIDHITFEDGTVLDVAAIKEMVQQGTDERDNLYAYDSGSLISAGAGHDYLYGAKGNDTLNGDDGNDQIYGRAGDDVLNGGAGNDGLSGEDGNDTLNGGTGNDYLNGGAGNDMLNGGAGDDSLTGGEGNDTYVFTQGSGKDTIYNYDTSANHQDTVRFEGMRAENVQFTKSGSDLVLTQQDGSSVRINNHFYHANYAVEHFAFDDQTISNPDFAKYVNSANQLIQTMSVFGQSSAVGSEVMNVVQNQNTPNLLVTNA